MFDDHPCLQVKRLQDASHALERDLETEKNRHAEARDEVTKLNNQVVNLNNTNEQLEKRRSELQSEVWPESRYLTKNCYNS